MKKFFRCFAFILIIMLYSVPLFIVIVIGGIIVSFTKIDITQTIIFDKFIQPLRWVEKNM